MGLRVILERDQLNTLTWSLPIGRSDPLRELRQRLIVIFNSGLAVRICSVLIYYILARATLADAERICLLQLVVVDFRRLRYYFRSLLVWKNRKYYCST